MMEDKAIGWSALEAAQAIRSGQISAERYAELLLGRCERLAHLNGFITIDRGMVLAESRQADRELQAGGPRGPLHGVPVAIKDNIDVAGLPTTAGTPTLSGHRPAADSPIVARLRDAGAIILGKANMHELAAGVTTDNAAYGTARNPYDTERVPGGSSGGTAVVVAARMAPCGLGTDTGASNRLPAAFCGIMGFRPSAGRWPQAGIVPNSPTRDVAGPMARTVADCALIDAIVTGEATDLAPIRLGDLRLGVPRQYFWSGLDPQIETLAQDWLQRLKAAGVTLIEAEVPDVAELTARAGLPIGVFEHEQALSAYLAEAGSPLCFADILDGIASEDVRLFFRAMREQISEQDYRVAIDLHRPRLQQAYRDYFACHALDAIMFPTTALLAPGIDEIRNLRADDYAGSLMARAIRNTDPGSIAGIPGISLAGGLTAGGLPAGLELDGPAGDDRRLLAIADAIASVLPATAPPPVE